MQRATERLVVAVRGVWSNPEPAVSGKVGASLRERTVSYSLSFLLEPFHTSPKEAESL